jgi:hypothetical protein
MENYVTVIIDTDLKNFVWDLAREGFVNSLLECSNRF